MSNQVERYTIVGKPVPYRPDSDIIPLAEIAIVEWRLEVALMGGASGPVRCSCEIWEHTIHEMEVLSSSLQAAAVEPFPQPFQVPRPESHIGTVLNLSLAVEMELCYSLAEPAAARARFFCSSREWGLHPRQHGVSIAAAVAGTYAEVVVEPQQALELADWLDRQIAMILAAAS